LSHVDLSQKTVADNFGGPGERPTSAALPDGFPSKFASNAAALR
jgi:hypothetical protein